MVRIITPGKAIKHLQRYRQVVSVLTKYGFGEFFGQIRIWEHIHIEKRLLHRETEYAGISTPQRLRMALEELGPTFIKLGQMMSTHPDILPHAYIVELEKLQDRVAPFPVQVARQIIETELKQPISAVFSSFTDEPIAAASLAQVHRAAIKGDEVVIKVQRPNIDRIIEVDLDIMHNLSVLMERYISAAQVIHPVGMVREFSESLHKELDFRIEANNMQRYARNFKETPWLHVPRLYLEKSNTQKILVMEYIQGIIVSDIPRLEKEGYDLKQIARHGADIGFRSILDHGFFHADPHPGNIMILPGNVFCLLDYGMMGSLSTHYRERLGRMIYYISNNDEKRTARALLSLMESKEVIDAETLEADVSEIIQEYAYLNINQIQLGSVLMRLLNLLREHHVRFPTNLSLLVKTITTLEDVALRLDPQFDMVSYAKPYARRFLLKSLNPVTRTKDAVLTSLDTVDLLRDLPYDAGVILDQLKKGRVKIEFEHIGLEPIRRAFTRASNRLAATLVLAALLIASALVILSHVPPLVGNIPLIGVIGFGIAVIMAISLIISMIFDRYK